VLLLLLYALRDHSLEDAERILRSAAVPGRVDIAGKVIQILKLKGAREQLFAGASPAEVFPPENRPLRVVGADDSEPDRLAYFRRKAEASYAAFRYAEILNDPDAAFAAGAEYRCAYYVAYAHLMRGAYGRAYAIAAPHVQDGQQELLSILLVAAENLPEPMAAEARRLYERAWAELDKRVEAGDRARTSDAL
jgi:hypothetical protein